MTSQPTLIVIQHIDREGPDLIGDCAKELGMKIQTIRPDRWESLPDPISTENTIAVLLGGPMSVQDRHSAPFAWLQKELEWLTQWHEQKYPVLGICLGAQLLAVAAGGTVHSLQLGMPSHPIKEVGFGAIHWLPEPISEPLLKGMNPSEMVLHWHGDRIRLPATATLMGSSLQCQEQVFRIDEHALGLQCHLEVRMTNLERWILEDHNYILSALGADGPNRLRQDSERFGDALERQGRLFISNALSYLSASTKKI